MVRAIITPNTNKIMASTHSMINCSLFPVSRKISFTSSNNSFSPFGSFFFLLSLIRFFML